jgi:hypothetical protein
MTSEDVNQAKEALERAESLTEDALDATKDAHHKVEALDDDGGGGGSGPSEDDIGSVDQSGGGGAGGGGSTND